GAELTRGDLRQRRGVRLPLRGDTDQDVDLPARIDANRGALEGAEARALRVAGNADTDRPRRTDGRHLPLAPVVVAERAQHALERRRIIAWVVRHRDAVLVGEAGTVGHFRGADEIAAAHVGGIEAQTSSAAIVPSGAKATAASCSCSRSWPTHCACSRRVSIHFTGRPRRNAATATSTSSAYTWPLVPNAPPTSGTITRTRSAAKPSTRAITSRWLYGLWIDAHTVSTPASAS